MAKKPEQHEAVIKPSEEPIKKWTVELPYCPSVTIEASTQEEAIKAYNTLMGITATENAYKVN
jgi:hypothetical protein